MRNARAFAVLGLAMAMFGTGAASCAGPGPCRYNSDCTDSYCADGVCKKDCVDAKYDCPTGYICNLIAKCELPGADGGVGGDGGRTDGGSEAGTGDGGGGDAGGGTKLVLDLCGSDAECASGLCKPSSVGALPRCTRACTSHANCPQGGRCVTVGTESYCAQSDIGRACTAANQCTFGCLTGPRYCTMNCQSGADCPNGYGCQPVGSPATNVCVKAEAPCGAGMTDACIAPAACDETGLVSGCTLACNTAADCPQRAAGLAPWTCNGVCRRPPDVYGPLAGGVPAEYACNAASTIINICNDAQHIDFNAFSVPAPPAVNCAAAMTTPGSTGDTCVDSCRYQGGCIDGFACTALGSVGAGRIGLCLPATGVGEVGVSCTRDGDCVFGYCNRNTGKCSRDCTVDGLCPTGSTCANGSPPAVEGRTFRRCE
ncbi:MAG: hypothetical protein HOO96_40785 [Polyangiaceae bacterium]|nr:hypothetical protein [Polyangiaceae bacterium]